MITKDYYKKSEKFVIDSFSKTRYDDQIRHFKRTAYWIKKLNQKADEALLISGMAHDIERAFRKEDVEYKKSSLKFNDLEFLRPHEERGAKIIGDFLKKEGADKKMIKRVKMLVSRHEEGGDEDQNILKDGDSISFFENNLSSFLKNNKDSSKEKIKHKLDWMYDRISSDKAKRIAKPFYKKAIKELGYSR